MQVTEEVKSVKAELKGVKANSTKIEARLTAIEDRFIAEFVFCFVCWPNYRAFAGSMNTNQMKRY